MGWNPETHEFLSSETVSNSIKEVELKNVDSTVESWECFDPDGYILDTD